MAMQHACNSLSAGLTDAGHRSMAQRNHDSVLTYVVSEEACATGTKVMAAVAATPPISSFFIMTLP
jgi:hypothetical protein